MVCHLQALVSFSSAFAGEDLELIDEEQHIWKDKKALL